MRGTALYFIQSFTPLLNWKTIVFQKPKCVGQCVVDGMPFLPSYSMRRIKRVAMISWFCSFAGTRSRRRKESPESIAAKFIAAKCDQDRFCVQIFPLKGTVIF